MLLTFCNTDMLQENRDFVLKKYSVKLNQYFGNVEESICKNQWLLFYSSDTCHTWLIDINTHVGYQEVTDHIHELLLIWMGY